MNIFKIRTIWSNSELAVLKLCVASFYISAGIYFHQQLEKYLLVFLIIFIIALIRIWRIWMKKSRF